MENEKMKKLLLKHMDEQQINDHMKEATSSEMFGELFYATETEQRVGEILVNFLNDSVKDDILNLCDVMSAELQDVSCDDFSMEIDDDIWSNNNSAPELNEFEENSEKVPIQTECKCENYSENKKVEIESHNENTVELFGMTDFQSDLLLSEPQFETESHEEDTSYFLIKIGKSIIDCNGDLIAVEQFSMEN